MNTPADGVHEFELPNVGTGPDPLRLSDVLDASDFAVLLFLRDYHCPKCRGQVAAMIEDARRFNELKAAVLPILPESAARARKWKNGFDGEFPFPLLADDDNTVSDAYDQPTRYGPLGAVHDLIGRLPQSLILDTRGEQATVVFVHEGESAGDRPEVEQLLEEVEELQESFVFDCSLVDC